MDGFCTRDESSESLDFTEMATLIQSLEGLKNSRQAMVKRACCGPELLQLGFVPTFPRASSSETDKHSRTTGSKGAMQSVEEPKLNQQSQATR